MAMRFGCCAGLSSFVKPTVTGSGVQAEDKEDKWQVIPLILKTLEDHGYDFVEFGVGLTVPEDTEEEFGKFKQAIAGSSLVPEAFNSFIPGTISLVGPEVDKARIRRYVETAARRVAEVGGQLIVFGSGAARNIPEGFSRSQAEDQILDFLQISADAAAANGIRIAIEPLSCEDTNFVTSVEEGIQWVEKLDQPEVRLLADFYHMTMEHEPLDHLLDAGGRLIHVHVADTDRLYPGSGRYDYDTFFRNLKQIGYEGRISVECNFRDFVTETGKALSFLRVKWDES